MKPDYYKTISISSNKEKRNKPPLQQEKTDAESRPINRPKENVRVINQSPEK